MLGSGAAPAVDPGWWGDRIVHWDAVAQSSRFGTVVGKLLEGDQLLVLLDGDTTVTAVSVEDVDGI